jgi:hypothetical protein
MKTDQQWLQEINDLYEGQKTGRITTVAAVELNNTLGKLIGIRKLKLEEEKMKFLLAAKVESEPLPLKNKEGE